jgi:hypothetical protein
LNYVTSSSFDPNQFKMGQRQNWDSVAEGRSFEKELLCNIYALGNTVSTFQLEWIKRAFEMNHTSGYDS